MQYPLTACYRYDTLPSPFVERIHREALSMLVEARNYFAYSLHRETGSLDPMDRFALTGHEFLVTSRLAWVMAWVLYRRAVDAGEITESEAAREIMAMEEDSICSAEDRADGLPLPRGLRDMLDRSHRIYLRVARLGPAATHH